MTATQARNIAARMKESGLLLAGERIQGVRTFGTDSWVIYLGSAPDGVAVRTPQDWTRIATERGAAREAARA